MKNFGNKKILIPSSIILFTIITSIFLIQSNSKLEDNSESTKFFDFEINTKNFDLIELDINSIFKISGIRGKYIQTENTLQYYKLLFELRPENQKLYEELSNTDKKTIVIYPVFTTSA